MQYDLEKRTKQFSVDIILLIKNIQTNTSNSNIISQLLKSATSIGANYREANGAVSKNDFNNKIHICRKEAQETEYWLELLEISNPEIKNKLEKIQKEAHELILIFKKISQKLKTTTK